MEITLAHHTVRKAYLELADRINRFPQGAPQTDLLLRILELLFSRREAELVAQLPVRPFTAARAAAVWKLSVVESRKVLDELASRAVLVDIESDEGTTYLLPPPMAGFFEFSWMRIREDLAAHRERARSARHRARAVSATTQPCTPQIF
ncbi:MAG: hypothetical protein QNL88_15620 [Acidobacteriota bacterium]|nr:hypothetical protein [Acidobacteriota bacterium]